MTTIQQASEPRVTIDDLKHRAEHVKNRAVAEAKDAVDTVIDYEAKHAVLVAVGAAFLVASVAYYLGTRAARRDRTS